MSENKQFSLKLTNETNDMTSSLSDREAEILIKINPKYERYSCDPALIHFNTIRDSVRDNGQCIKIILNEKGIILDGHIRYKACISLGLVPQFEIRSFDTIEDEEEFVIDCNLTRKHLTTCERVELCEQLLPLLKKQAEQRQKLGKKLTFTQDYVKVSAHDNATDSILARRAGISASTYRKYRTVVNSDDGRLKDDLKDRKISVTKACNILKKYSQKITPNKIPEIKYSVIVANPKWVNRDSSINASHYPHIIKSCSDENAVLVLCVSNKHIPDAIDLVRNSGFKYQRLHAEHDKKFIIVAKRGNVTLPDLEFSSDKTIHETIENAFPSQKYVDLWADKKHSDKWNTRSETVTVSVPENIPECRRSMQSKLEEHYTNFERYGFD